MSVFKFYDEAVVSTDYTNPLPMFLHNPDTVAITLTVNPGQAFLYSPLKTNESMLAAVRTKPTLLAAKVATDYATTTNGHGTGAQVRATVADVGNTLNNFLKGASGAIFGGSGIPAGDGVQTYEPSTNGSGTGFKVKFAVSGTAVSQIITGLEVINAGSGYAVGDTLTFTAADEGEFTRVLAASEVDVLFSLSALIPDPDALGKNYLAGDFLYFTLTETVEMVDYEYPVQLQIPTAAINISSFTYILGVGDTTPFTVVKFQVGGTTDVLAHL